LIQTALSDEELAAIIVAGREGNSELSDDQGDRRFGAGTGAPA
jgi:hypothetical protein